MFGRSWLLLNAMLLQSNSATAAVNAGNTFDQSPTTAYRACEKMLASRSLSMATMFLADEHPAMCWLAPEIPTVM